MDTLKAKPEVNTMQIIIIGCGKVGSALAGELIDQGHEVVIIESDLQAIQNADDLDCIKITGVPIDRDVLKQAGIETADVLCAVTQNDNINIMVAQIAKEIFKVPRIVARIFNPISREVFDQFQINTICQTELTVASHPAQDIRRGARAEPPGLQHQYPLYQRAN